MPDAEPLGEGPHHELRRTRDDRDDVALLLVLAQQLRGPWIDRADHRLLAPDASLALELGLRLAAELDHHVLGPVADVEDPELVLEVGAEAPEQLETADLAPLVAVAHVEAARVLGDQRLVEVEEGADPGRLAEGYGEGHAGLAAQKT